MTEWFSEAWEALGQHAGPLEALAVLGAAVWFVIYPARRWWANRQPPPSVTLANPEALRPIASAAPPTGSMHMDLATFEAIQERALDAARKQLAAAHGAERQNLEDKIEALNARLRDPDEALAQQQAIITGLEEQLTRRSNEIGGDDLAAARTALETGDFTKARALFETLAARTAPQVAANADAEFALGQIAEAEIRWHDAHRHYKRAAQLSDALDHLRAQARMTWHLRLTDEGIPLHERLCAAVLSEHGETSAEYAIELNNLASLVRAQGRYAEAEGLYRQALDISRATIGEVHPDYATNLSNLAGVVRQQGRYAEAEGLYRQSLGIDQATIGEAHPEFATHLNNLAVVVEAQGRCAEAEGLYRQVLDIDRATIGEAHPGFATHLNNLANVVRAQGRYDQAQGLYRQALDIDRATIGEVHPEFATRLNNFALVVEAQGRYAEAEGIYRQALDIDRATIGEAHPSYATHLSNFANVVAAQGRYAEAEALFSQALSQCRKTLGDGHPNTRAFATNLLGLLTTHLPNSPHLATVRAVLAAGPVSPNPYPNLKPTE
jgi:tetratricopeptide (TPR) repeat protein